MNPITNTNMNTNIHTTDANMQTCVNTGVKSNITNTKILRTSNIHTDSNMQTCVNNDAKSNSNNKHTNTLNKNNDRNAILGDKHNTNYYQTKNFKYDTMLE